MRSYLNVLVDCDKFYWAVSSIFLAWSHFKGIILPCSIVWNIATHSDGIDHVVVFNGSIGPEWIFRCQEGATSVAVDGEQQIPLVGASPHHWQWLLAFAQKDLVKKNIIYKNIPKQSNSISFHSLILILCSFSFPLVCYWKHSEIHADPWTKKLGIHRLGWPTSEPWVSL